MMKKFATAALGITLAAGPAAFAGQAGQAASTTQSSHPRAKKAKTVRKGNASTPANSPSAHPTK